MLHDVDPLLTLASILIAGVAMGAVARRLGLPGITGQILAGVVLGKGLVGLFDDHAIHGLAPITHFALGLMAVTVGAHLNVRRLRNAGKRLALLLLFESLITPVLVLVGLGFLPGVDGPMAALLAAIAISTAPATIVALVRETRAKGVFVKTLIAAVALNNMACILFFEVARAYAGAVWSDSDGAVSQGLLAPALQFIGALLLGGAAAFGADGMTRLVRGEDRRSTAAFAAILLTVGLAQTLDVSPLLSCLLLGFVQANINPEREKLVDKVFSNFEPAIMAIFFTLAGLHLELEHAALAGLAAVVYFALRAVGKIAAVHVAMRIAGATEALRKNLGMALLPQAGLAIGLVLLVRDDPAFAARSDELALFVAVVLTVVTANEIVGPILTRLGLQRSGEAGQDRMRLIDFLEEEHIVTGLEARTKEEAIEKLVDLLVQTHHIEGLDRDEFLRTVMEREAELSTCLGEGLAIPHGILPENTRLVGVMGLSQKGLPFQTPDKKPVHCMVLLGTPPDQRERHLEVLATLARVAGLEVATRDALFSAETPAHAWELLHGTESEGFNYFLEADGE